ncbi:hypothetical protein VFPBJ_11602 [Purpureocillium lilacinum]|uniref:Uncharacterized protein n=1 Tax=Purpureocillium lilacinum TaxID=33203 RepID=A0A179F2Y6_PURLI|nr:hypothetical protein VFPBJ_11602 [Purpureocillium lilacinum]
MSAIHHDQSVSGSDRRPLDSQKYVGGDMSMMAFVQPAAAPNRFAYPDDHHYAPILGDAEPLSPSIFFSLNISLYNQQIDASEWANHWFFMTGRVHPYALTWELERRDGLESDGDNISQYTVPTFVVRDHGFQPVSPRLLGSSSAYPTIMPVVSFTGPVVGSGLDLLHADAATAFDDPQLKCCGFVQLSTFLSPGKPEQTPYKGFHPFQVFVIFPVHANPWTSLCKKMAQRRDSQFHPGAPFTCTGKVAGLLAHKHMRKPPALEQDYIFIVVPDTWTFLDKASFNQPPTALFTPATPKRPDSGASEYDDAMARFTTTKKRHGPSEGGAPVTPKSLPPAPTGTSTKRPLPNLYDTPSKKPCPPSAPSAVFVARDSNEPYSQDSLDDADEIAEEDGEDDDVRDDGEGDDNDASGVEPPDGSSATDHGSPDISTTGLPRPLRNRHPPRKYPEAV